MRFLGALIVIVTCSFAGARTCDDLFASTIATFRQISRPGKITNPAASTLAVSTVVASPDFVLLWEIPDRTHHASVDFRKPLSAESTHYIRRATGLAALSDAQVEELYNNNLRLLALRARDKAESMIVDAIFSMASVETVIADIAGRRPMLSPYATPSLVRGSMESAVHNSGEREFSLQEITAIVELQILEKLPPGIIDRATEQTFTDDAMMRLRPTLAHRIQIEIEPGCCKTAACNTCPNSLRLREEVLKQTGQKLNVHLKKIDGEEPPAQLQLFALQDLLRGRFPDTSW